jgi:hypothetical protein
MTLLRKVRVWGRADRPEDCHLYSMGYHIQTGNKDDFLYFDFGPLEHALRSQVHSKRQGCLSPKKIGALSALCF